MRIPGHNPRRACCFMAREVQNEGDGESQNYSGGKYVAQHGNSEEKYQHAAEGENCAGDASADGDFREVNLRA